MDDRTPWMPDSVWERVSVIPADSRTNMSAIGDGSRILGYMVLCGGGQFYPLHWFN